jgi:hypothetical protein
VPFISVPFTIDAETLADEALDRLADAWDDWEGSDGDLEVIQIESLAPMAADVGEAASIVPDAIFRNYGQRLLGVTYQAGAPALGTAVFTAIDNVGYATTAPVELDLGGVAFSTDDVVVIAAGQTTVSVDITANETGVDGNGQSGFADLMTPLPWVSQVQVATPTSAGAEAETDEEYQDRLADRLLLQTTTLITGRDFEIMAMQVDGVGRAMAMPNQARAVVVALTDSAGEPVAAAVKTTVLGLFDDYRQVNTTYSVIDATYTTINVTYTVAVVPGYEPATVLSACTAAINEWLSPANWGSPRTTDGDPGDQWLNDTVVRFSELQRTLAVLGVRYVQAATLNGGTADINLTGTAPLTRPGTITGTAI